MGKVKVEFFHDVICSYCFPMSYKLRRVVDEIDDIEVIHRSFALVPSDEYFEIMFGDHKFAKRELTKHWEDANNLDELKRININKIKEVDFLFPNSMTGLLACEAAYFLGGDNLYWDVFDSLQRKLFINCENIGDKDVLYEAVKEVGLDFEKWKEYFKSKEVEKSVLDDFNLVDEYKVEVVPTLIINNKYKIGPYTSYDELKETLLEIKNKEE